MLRRTALSRIAMRAHTVPTTLLAHSSTSSARSPTLPRLPVPDLHETLRKYLTSLEPFMQEDEARGISSFEEKCVRSVSVRLKSHRCLIGWTIISG